MSEGADPVERSSLLAELRLDEVPDLLAGLETLARMLSAQSGGAATAVLLLDDGVTRRAVPASTLPASAHSASARVSIAGHDIGCMRLQPQGAGAPPTEMLEQTARLASALLLARLREVRAQAGGRHTQEDDALLRAALQAVPDLWFVVDRDDRYLLCSDENHPSLIEPFAQQIGKPFAASLAPPFDSMALEAVRRARASGDMQRLEYEAPTRDAMVRTFEARVAPMGDGKVLYLTRDLTALRQLEQDLLLLQRAAEADAAMPLVVTDATQPDAPIIYVNAAFEHLTGYSRAEVLGRNSHFLLDTEQAQPHLPELRAAMAEGRACKVVLASRRRDGSGFLNELSIVPIRDAHGVLVQHLGVLNDVTERHATAQALEAAELRWRFALEGVGDGVWDHDETTQQSFFSARWKAMLGYAEHEISTALDEWLQRIHPEDRERVEQALADYRTGRSAAYQTEYRLRHRDGRWLWVLDRGKIVERRADGTPGRIVGIHTDITRIKEAKQALLDKQAAELASRAKSEFLSRMSHEMRTPLNAVIGFTQLLRLQPDSEPGKVVEYADHILRASEHLLGLVNEVLDLQRVEEGSATLAPRALELSGFVDDALELLRPIAQAEGIALSNQVPSGRWVWADDRCLRQVLMNMLSNAVKYNRSGGWVVLSLLDAPPGRCALAIEDTGSGLSGEQLARLFQPFERLGHESSGIEGSGLGLVITRSLIAQMGGSVTLSSVPGAGTLARIELPAVAAPEVGAPPPLPAPALAPTAPPPPSPAASALRLLYVEDNRINALLFEEAMRLLGGIELRISETGAEALALVQTWRPDVLVLDAHLPDIGGHDLLLRLRARPELAAVPAFMCSADAMPEDVERALTGGFQGYWTKPIEMNKVSAALSKLRDAHRP